VEIEDDDDNEGGEDEYRSDSDQDDDDDDLVTASPSRAEDVEALIRSPSEGSALNTPTTDRSSSPALTVSVTLPADGSASKLEQDGTKPPSPLLGRDDTIRRGGTMRRSSTKKEGEGEDSAGLVSTQTIVAGYKFVRSPSDIALSQLAQNPSALTLSGLPAALAAAAGISAGISGAPAGSVEAGEAPPSDSTTSAAEEATQDGTADDGTSLKKRPTLFGITSSIISNRRASKNVSENQAAKADRVEMIKDGPTGKNIVCIGTVWALVGLFTAVGELDHDYVLEFLSTHKLFTTPIKVLQYMLTRWNLSLKSEEMQTVFVQSRTLLVLDQWLQRHPRDFATNQSLHDSVKKFAESAQPLPQTNSALQSIKNLLSTSKKRLDAIEDVNKELFAHTIVSRANVVSRLEDPPHSPMTPTSPFSLGSPSQVISPSPSTPTGGAVSQFYTRSSRAIADFPGDFKPINLAEMLCVEEIRIFRSLTEDDFGRLITKTEQGNSRIKLFSRWSQLVSYWIASEVCKPDDVKQRAEAIKFFLNTASQCLQLQNYNAVSEIIRGLSLSPCQRLLKTWKALPSQMKTLYQDLSALVSSKDNYVLYRSALQKSEGHVLPIFRTYLADLDVITTKMETELPGGQINFYKFHVIGNILSSIYFCQKNTVYNYDVDKALRQYVSDMIAASALQDTDSLAKLSRLREAPLPSRMTCFFFFIFTFFLFR